MNRRFVAPLIAAVLVTLSCTEVADPGHTHGGCTAAYNTAWQTWVQGEISHSDLRSCPIGLNPGQLAISTAKAWDLTATYPVLQASSLKSNAYTQKYSDLVCAGQLGTDDIEFFYFGQPRPGSSASMESQADPALAWLVQTTPEYVCHKVNHFYTLDDIRAVITINYWGTQW